MDEVRKCECGCGKIVKSEGKRFLWGHNKFTIRKSCIICNREIIRGKSWSKTPQRGRNTVTCKKECSKIYNRIAQYIRGIDKYNGKYSGRRKE